MDKESKGFTYLRQKFPKISEVKMNEGIFVGPQVKQLFEDQEFGTKIKFYGEKRPEDISKLLQKLPRQ